MSIKQATGYLNNHSKTIDFNGETYVKKTDVIHALQFANKLQGFLYLQKKPLCSGYYFVKEYGKQHTKTAYYDSKADNFKIGSWVIDVEIWAHTIELEVTK